MPSAPTTFNPRRVIRAAQRIGRTPFPDIKSWDDYGPRLNALLDPARPLLHLVPETAVVTHALGSYPPTAPTLWKALQRRLPAAIAGFQQTFPQEGKLPIEELLRLPPDPFRDEEPTTALALTNVILPMGGDIFQEAPLAPIIPIRLGGLTTQGLALYVGRLASHAKIESPFAVPTPFEPATTGGVRDYLSTLWGEGWDEAAQAIDVVRRLPGIIQGTNGSLSYRYTTTGGYREGALIPHLDRRTVEMRVKQVEPEMVFAVGMRVVYQDTWLLHSGSLVASSDGNIIPAFWQVATRRVPFSDREQRDLEQHSYSFAPGYLLRHSPAVPLEELQTRNILLMAIGGRLLLAGEGSGPWPPFWNEERRVVDKGKNSVEVSLTDTRTGESFGSSLQKHGFGFEGETTWGRVTGLPILNKETLPTMAWQMPWF